MRKQKRSKGRIGQTNDRSACPPFFINRPRGQNSSLNNLQGKIVALDFWATWSGPCKASMPGMQMAVNKYKDSQDIKFLFIDCWETDNNYPELVKSAKNDNVFNR